MRHENISRKLVTVSILCLLAMGPSLVLAQQSGGTGNQPGQTGGTSNQPSTFALQNPLKVDSVAGLVEEGVTIFSYVVVLLGVLALVYVGLQFILARGNADRIKELRGWLLWIVVGVAVVIGARVIVSVVINTLGASGAVDQRVIQSANDALK